MEINAESVEKKVMKIEYKLELEDLGGDGVYNVDWRIEGAQGWDFFLGRRHADATVTDFRSWLRSHGFDLEQEYELVEVER